MLRPIAFVVFALLLIGNASPAREHYHWYPASEEAKPRPWAVLLPRAAGIGTLTAGNHVWDYAAWLNARGIDAMIIDYDRAARRLPAASGKTGPKLAAIVADALTNARAQGRMDMRCAGVVVGWSRGGEGALTLASKAEGGLTGIKLAIVYYPSVRGQERPYRQLHPIEALQGDDDGVAPAEALEKLKDSRPPGWPDFEIRTYRNVGHRFDVAHPNDDPAGPTPSDYNGNVSAEALEMSDYALKKYGIIGGCALD